MGIKHLLWVCPVCGAEDALREQGRDTVCSACGTRLERVDGARIRLTAPDGAVETASPAALLDRIPSPEILLDRDLDPVRQARISLRTAESDGVVRMGGRFLNRYERFGDPVEGTLRLHADRIVFRAEDGGETVWPFDRLTAVQASSTTLQLKGRERPVSSVRFHDDSVHVWETLLEAALQAYYTRRGWGEIQEIQPRIVAR